MPWDNLPPNWTEDSLKKFWNTLTSAAPKHKVTECIDKMKDSGMDDPGAFCASLADKTIPGWRKKVQEEKQKKKADLVLQGRLLHIAAELPQGDETRRRLLAALREAKRYRMDPDEWADFDFAQWQQKVTNAAVQALKSFPEVDSVGRPQIGKDDRITIPFTRDVPRWGPEVDEWSRESTEFWFTDKIRDKLAPLLTKTMVHEGPFYGLSRTEDWLWGSTTDGINWTMTIHPHAKR